MAAKIGTVPRERLGSWLHGFRRLRTSYDQSADIHDALMALSNASLIFEYLNPSIVRAF